jgi:hypothetical protein
MSQIFFSLICLFLVITEMSLAEKHIAECWPLFSKRSSLVSLGIAEVFVGVYLLGSLNETFASRENLGDALYPLLVGPFVKLGREILMAK